MGCSQLAAAAAPYQRRSRWSPTTPSSAASLLPCSSYFKADMVPFGTGLETQPGASATLDFLTVRGAVAPSCVHASAETGVQVRRAHAHACLPAHVGSPCPLACCA